MDVKIRIEPEIKYDRESLSFSIGSLFMVFKDNKENIIGEKILLNKILNCSKIKLYRLEGIYSNRFHSQGFDRKKPKEHITLYWSEDFQGRKIVSAEYLDANLILIETDYLINIFQRSR